MNVTVEELRVTWAEPESTCDCVANYTVELNDSDVGTAACGASTGFELPLSPNSSECIPYFVTLTPVLNNGEVVVTSKSDPAPFILGQEGKSCYVIACQVMS